MNKFAIGQRVIVSKPLNPFLNFQKGYYGHVHSIIEAQGNLRQNVYDIDLQGRIGGEVESFMFDGPEPFFEDELEAID